MKSRNELNQKVSPFFRRAVRFGGAFAMIGSTFACSSSEVAGEPSVAPVEQSAPLSSTTTIQESVIGDTAPLTGLVALSELPDSVLAIKIDNSPDAWPQVGINQADIVFEENVEGWTRFIAVFHSQQSDPVGPIRSIRTQDVDILNSFGTVGLVGSGGNEKVLAAIGNSSLLNLSYTGWDDVGDFYRDEKRQSPHNLFASTTKLFEGITATSSEVQPQFSYADQTMSNGSRPVGGLILQMKGSMRAVWQWNQQTERYERFNEYEAAIDSAGQPVTSDNVIAVVTSYRPSKADPRSPEAITVGTGDVAVFSGGNLQVGFWSRDDNTSPWTLTSSDGQPIFLKPGRTWVELVTPDQVGVLALGQDISLVQWPS